MKKIFSYIIIVLCILSCSNKQNVIETVELNINSVYAMKINKDFQIVESTTQDQLRSSMQKQDIFEADSLITAYITADNNSTMLISEITESDFENTYDNYLNQLKSIFSDKDVLIGKRIINDLDVRQVVINANVTINRFFVVGQESIIKIDFITQNGTDFLNNIKSSIESIKKRRSDL